MFEIVQAAGLLVVCLNLCLLLTILKAQSSTFNSNTVNANNKVVVILPVFKEQHTIAGTIEFLMEVVYENVAEIVIVGNVKERNENGCNETLDAAKLQTAGVSKFRVIECPIADAIKAHQLNYAISTLEFDPADTWVHLIDIDTRFKDNDFDEVLLRVGEGHNIIQQHSHFLQNYERNRIIGRLAAAYQSRWTLTHEIPRIWLFNRTGIGMYHLVGHGLCINLAKLKEIGGFSEKFKIEDIHLGYLCAMRGEPVLSCSSLEGSDCPNSLKQWWWQQYWWSIGAMQGPLYIRDLELRGFPVSVYNYVQQIFSIWNYARWLLHSAWMLFVVASLGLGFGVQFVVMFFVVYSSTFVVSGLVLRKRGYCSGSVTNFVLAGVGYAFIRSAPVLHGFIESVMRVSRTKYKTTH